MNIPLSAPDIGDRELDYVKKILKSGQLSLGPCLSEFEENFASYTGSRFAVAVNSGTSALHLCVRALGIGPKDEVITTSFSFVASVNCLLYEGALPALVDIDPNTLNLDPGAVRQFLEKRCSRSRSGPPVDRETGRVVKAILPVHIFGLPCQMDELMSIAREYNLLVLEDACEAIGATFHGQRVGTFGSASVFAFYPNKQMTTGEGGMITTNDPGVAELCRSMRNQGRDPSGTWLNHVRLGYNYRLSELHAGLGLAQLQRIDELLTARARVARRYSKLLAGQDLIKVPEELDGIERSWFVYFVQFQGDSAAMLRDHVRNALHAHGIGNQIYFTPIHRQPFFEHCEPQAASRLPHTDQAGEQCLALPFHSRLTESEIEFVCATLISAVESANHRELAVSGPFTSANALP